jgi:hypothetical protein
LSRFVSNLRPIVLATLLTVFPIAAQADLFVSPKGEPPVTAVEKRVLLVHSGRVESIVEQIVVTSPTPTFVWLRPFPSRPNVRPAPRDLFATLDAGTVVEEPYNEAVRRTLFGPSVVTALTRRLMDPPSRRETDGYQEARRPLELGATEIFSGRVMTSTITHELILPEELTQYFTRENMVVSEEEKRELARYLNRDWFVSATSVQDAAPSDQTKAVLGPARFDVESVTVLYPQMGLERPYSKIPTDFFLVSSGALTPAAFRTVWDARPWEQHPKRRGEFVATYSQPIDPEGPLAYEIGEKGALLVGPGSHLVRSLYERGNETLIDIELVHARDPTLIPGSGRRSSATDIILCILLGIAPLIYTPESWFLLWLAARAKERIRREGKGFGTKLWSIYAVVVAIFWFATIDGTGRLAALAPMMIGIVQLALPYTQRDPAPVRAAFKRKKA